MGSQSIIQDDRHNSSVLSRSNSDVNRSDEAERSPNSNSKSDLLNSKPNLSSGLTDSDWTELLSVPDKKVVSGAGSMSRGSNRMSGIRALKKDGKKVGNSGPGSNLSVVDGRSEKVQKNGVLKSSRKSNVELENNTSADSDEKASNVGDATPRTSSAQSPSSGGEFDQKDSNSVSVTDYTNIEKMGRMKGVNNTVDVEKLHLLDDSERSSGKMSTSRERKLDIKAGLSNGEKHKRGISGADRSRLDPRTSRSTKKVSSLPSDGESNSETDTTSSSDSEREREREREERIKRRQQILAERAAAKALEAIKEHENLVARLEGEKQSLEKILDERAKQQVEEVIRRY